jgi:hypothetical protein
MPDRDQLQETAAVYGVLPGADSDQALAPQDERFSALEEQAMGTITSSEDIDLPVMVV